MGASQIMDVIVVGLGASGIAAVRKLHDAGLKVLGLEAADRIGGRIHTVQFGECSTDLGAAWCHGEKQNIVFEIVNKYDLLGRPSKPEHKWFLKSNGVLLPQEIGQSIENVLREELDKADKNNAMSISECLRNSIKTNDTLQKDPTLSKSFVEYFERDNHVGGQIDPKTGKSLKGLVENWPCEGEPMLNWKGKGYKTILDILLNKYPDPSKEIQVELLLNKEVNNIRWGTSHFVADDVNPLVQVKCKDGSLYAAKSVLVTMSVGVLKERHSQLFSPPLPPAKVNAINNLQLCVLDKIYIEFEKPWWKHPSTFSILWSEDDKKNYAEDEQWITEISALWTVEHQPNLLLAWIYGEGAKVMETKSTEEVKAGVQKLMDRVVEKEFDVSPIKAILRSEWASNPLIRGSYSYRSVTTEENGGDAKTLSEPLCRVANNFPIVCFGGEATSHRRHNAVHGAVEAGFREAERLIESIKNQRK